VTAGPLLRLQLVNRQLQGVVNSKKSHYKHHNIVDCNLTEGCMVEAVKTATEAKTVAIRELDIRSRFSATSPPDIDRQRCSMLHQKRRTNKVCWNLHNSGRVNWEVCARGVKTAIYNQENISPNRPLVERLTDRCLSLETVISQVSDGMITSESSDSTTSETI